MNSRVIKKLSAPTLHNIPSNPDVILHITIVSITITVQFAIFDFKCNLD